MKYDEQPSVPMRIFPRIEKRWISRLINEVVNDNSFGIFGIGHDY